MNLFGWMQTLKILFKYKCRIRIIMDYHFDWTIFFKICKYPNRSEQTMARKKTKFRDRDTYTHSQKHPQRISSVCYTYASLIKRERERERIKVTERYANVRCLSSIHPSMHTDAYRLATFWWKTRFFFGWVLVLLWCAKVWLKSIYHDIYSKLPNIYVHTACACFHFIKRQLLTPLPRL